MSNKIPMRKTLERMMKWLPVGSKESAGGYEFLRGQGFWSVRHIATDHVEIRFKRNVLRAFMACRAWVKDNDKTEMKGK